MENNTNLMYNYVFKQNIARIFTIKVIYMSLKQNLYLSHQSDKQKVPWKVMESTLILIMVCILHDRTDA